MGPELVADPGHRLDQGGVGERGTRRVVEAGARISAALRRARLKQRSTGALTAEATEAEATPAHHARFLESEIARSAPLILAAGLIAA